MNHLRVPIGCVTLLASLAACDSRADQDYRGESLLHLEGRVVLADESAPEGLVPAVVYSTRTGLELVDVTVQGQFPADFRLDLYAPPPPSAIAVDTRAELPAEKGEFAIGSITAARPDHLPKLLLASRESSFKVDRQAPTGFLDHPLCAEDPRCLQAGQKCADDARCVSFEEWCVDETEKECRTVGLGSCETKGDVDECEPLFSEGNELIFTDTRAVKQFAGFSERYVVFWTRSGLPKTHYYLAALGVEEDLAPGYTLVELGEERDWGHDSDSDSTSAEGSSSSDDDYSEGLAPDEALANADPCTQEPPSVAVPGTTECIGYSCVELFSAETFARYNERHGTSYRCVAEVDKLDFDEAVTVGDDLTYIAEKIALAHGLSIAQLVGTKVIHDPSLKLSIRISPDAEPPVIF